MCIEELYPEICINECCKSCDFVKMYDNTYYDIIKLLIRVSCHPCQKFGICNKCCRECTESHIHTYTTSMRIGTL